MNNDGSDYIKTQAVGKGLVIAIDGPSGSGKSTVARRLAAEMDVKYLDTGAMYRTLVLWANQQGVDLSDEPSISELSRSLPLVVEPFAHAPRFILDGRNVTQRLHSQEVSKVVSQVATNLAVREEMVRRQREIVMEAHASTRGIVVEGRDTTTVVAPDAHVRVLLTASPQVRLARRARELQVEEDMIRQQVQGRDLADSTVSEFMEPAAGVELIDTSDLSLDEVKGRIIELVRCVLGV